MRYGKRAAAALAIGIAALLLGIALNSSVALLMAAAQPVAMILGIIGIVVDRPRTLAIVMTAISGGLIALGAFPISRAWLLENRIAISCIINYGTPLLVIVFSLFVRRLYVCIAFGVVAMSIANFFGNAAFGDGNTALPGFFLYPLYGCIIAFVSVRVAAKVRKKRMPSGG